MLHIFLVYATCQPPRMAPSDWFAVAGCWATSRDTDLRLRILPRARDGSSRHANEKTIKPHARKKTNKFRQKINKYLFIFVCECCERVSGVRYACAKTVTQY